LTAIRDIVSEQRQKVTALDMEWDTRQDANGQVCWQGTVALSQIGYRKADGVIWAALFQISQVKTLPAGFIALLNDPAMTFVGVGLTTDLAKLGRDFNCSVLTSRACTRCRNLGVYARERDVVKNGTGNTKMDKSRGVRLSQG
jgi:hypothetical protein